MTDRPAPRVPRANPAPRRALPRVTPLGAGGTAPTEPVGDGGSATAGQEPEPATGRDLLIPNGASQPRRKGRGSGTVPTLAELMPPSRPHHHGGKSGRAGRVGGGGSVGKDHEAKDKHGKAGKQPRDPQESKESKGLKESKDLKDGKEVKEGALQVTLSKGLRKRLRSKASELGLSPEDAIAQLVEVWVDG